MREQGLGLGKKPATIRRYLASLGRWHRIIEAPDPTRSELVKLELKALLKETADRPDQAEPLNWARLNRITEYFDHQQEASGRVDLAWLRDRTLLWLAYDLMARRSELVALDVRDLRQDEHGSALIRRSKTDPDGRGASAFVADQTLQYTQTWLSLAAIETGPLLRPVAKGGRVQDGRLTGRSVSRILKARAKCLGLAYEDWMRISGHSARVGAAQDLTAENFGIAAIKQAGRWKSDRMPARYTEHLQAARGAMAKLAARQGRTGMNSGTDGI